MVEQHGGRVEQLPQFTIRDPETVRLIREATQREGKFMTAVVAEAVEEKLVRDSKPTVNEKRMHYVFGLTSEYGNTWSK
jgi:hypothetical protein